MQIQKIHEITFATEESIITATLANANECVLLLSSGIVVRFHIQERQTEHLFSVYHQIGYSDGGFDLNSQSTIYTLDSIVVVVNDYKRHGFVYYPEKYHALNLWREDYHADISCYPIGLYKDEAGI